MKKLFLILFCLPVFTLAVKAQDTPTIEASAGFVATHFTNLNFQGVIGTFNYNAVKFGGENVLAGSIEAGYSRITGVEAYSIHAGPEYSYGEKNKVFVRALFGNVRLENSGLHDNAFSGIFGVGAKVPVSKRLFVRTGVDYVFTRFGSTTQDGVRVHVGLGFGY